MHDLGMRWITPSAARRFRPFWKLSALFSLVFMGAAFAVIIFFIVLGRYLSVHGLDQLASAEELTKSFDLVMHTFDHYPLDDRHPIQKWTKDVPVFFDASVPEWHRKMAERQLPLIAQLTGLRFIAATAYNPKSTLNVVLAEGPKAMLKEARRFAGPKEKFGSFEKVMCFAMTNDDPNGRIQGALAFFGVKRQSTNSHSCLIEELLHGFGPRADRATYTPSIFSEFTNPVEIPLNDQVLLRALYDPKIKPGMSSEQTRELVPDIIRGLIEGVKARGPEALYQH